jgi:aminopeptidase
MRDERNEILAQMLLTYSVDLQRGERLMIEMRGQDTLELAREIIRQATQLGGVPFWYYNDRSLTRVWAQGASEEQMDAYGQLHLKLMKEIDAWRSASRIPSGASSTTLATPWPSWRR